jgi:protein gp37
VTKDFAHSHKLAIVLKKKKPQIALVDTVRVNKGLWWQDTWNWLAGCSFVDAGCTHCYACGLTATRLSKQPNYAGLAGPSKSGPTWSNEVRVLGEKLSNAGFTKKPARIFVNDMSDTWHPDVPSEDVAASIEISRLYHNHRFMYLTKRAQLCREYLGLKHYISPKNLRNIWFGFSASYQKAFDRRWIDMKALAAYGYRVFVSLEPLLGYVELPEDFLDLGDQAWVVTGGESGARARITNLNQIEHVVAQCKGRVPCFVKQLGNNPAREQSTDGTSYLCPVPLKSRKGTDMTEWPCELRVRQMPVD